MRPNNGQLRILKHLERHGSITKSVAKDVYGIGNAGARIQELRGILPKGRIETVMTDGRNKFGEPVRFAVYTLSRRKLK